MAKGRVITDDIRFLIVRLHTEHPDWPAKMIKDELHRRLGQNWPGLSAVQKVIQKATDIDKQLGSDSHDNPWTVASMAKYPIPPEALPSVLQVWYFWWNEGSTFTIREAQWVARLYAAVKNTEDLVMLSREMLKAEKLLEKTGRDFIPLLQADNLHTFYSMTGRKPSWEELNKALGLPDGVLPEIIEKIKADVLKDPKSFLSELEDYLRQNPHVKPKLAELEWLERILNEPKEKGGER